MTNEFPPMIGKYKVLGVIAKGGMGVVYKAIHPSLKRYIVIKKLTKRGNNSGNAERFKKEAQILLDLQSPYIVHLFDYFTEGGYRYMVEELVDGSALDKLIQKQTVLPPPVAMLVLQDACYALKYAHSKDIVHRDIKPGNILISKRGEVKLADFGIASDSNQDGMDSGITQSGMALGTPAYMPPEQFENSASVDNRADIYALGIMLYEMITGTKPYPGTFTIETLRTIQKGKYIHPRTIDKSIPGEIERLIHKMIRPNRKQRFKSIDGVLRIVKKYLHHYDTHELRVQLARSVIATKDYQYRNCNPKDKKIRLVAKIAGLVILLGLLFGFFWRIGFFHRTILSKVYTPVNVEMRIPKAMNANLDLPIKAFFFYNKDDIPEVEGSSRYFDVKGTKRIEDILSFKPKIEVSSEKEKNVTYDIAPLYLKKGSYRMKIAVGPYIYWESFKVDKNPVLLNVDVLRNAHRNLQISASIKDFETGADISQEAIIEVKYKDKWVNIRSIAPEKIKTSNVWKIRVSAEGYESEEFSLLIDWYQDQLHIAAEIKKSDKPVEKKTTTKSSTAKKTTRTTRRSTTKRR